MNISRLKAYGARWEEWVRVSRYRKEPRVIPTKHRNKKMLRQRASGEYEIHAALWDAAAALGLPDQRVTQQAAPPPQRAPANAARRARAAAPQRARARAPQPMRAPRPPPPQQAAAPAARPNFGPGVADNR